MKSKALGILLLSSAVACSDGTQNQDASPQAKTKTQNMLAENGVNKVPDSLYKMNDCRSDNECIIVDGGCGSPMAINRKYRDAAQPHLLLIYAAVDCAAPSQEANPSIAACQENICAVAD
jgi:hypothetical protein